MPNQCAVCKGTATTPLILRELHLHLCDGCADDLAFLMNEHLED